MTTFLSNAFAFVLIKVALDVAEAYAGPGLDESC